MPHTQRRRRPQLLPAGVVRVGDAQPQLPPGVERIGDVEPQLPPGVTRVGDVEQPELTRAQLRTQLGIPEDPGNIAVQAGRGFVLGAKGALGFAKQVGSAALALPRVVSRSLGFEGREIGRATRGGFVEGATELPRAVLSGELGVKELAGIQEGLTPVEQAGKIGFDVAMFAATKKIPTAKIPVLGPVLKARAARAAARAEAAAPPAAPRLAPSGPLRAEPTQVALPFNQPGRPSIASPGATGIAPGGSPSPAARVAPTPSTARPAGAPGLPEVIPDSVPPVGRGPFELAPGLGIDVEAALAGGVRGVTPIRGAVPRGTLPAPRPVTAPGIPEGPIRRGMTATEPTTGTVVKVIDIRPKNCWDTHAVASRACGFAHQFREAPTWECACS